LYARCVAENGNPQKSLKLLDKDWPDDLTAETQQKILIAQGNTHHILGNDRDALDFYAAAFELGDDNPELLYKIALSMALIDRIEDSLAALERLITIDSDYPGSKQLYDLLALKVKLIG